MKYMIVLFFSLSQMTLFSCSFIPNQKGNPRGTGTEDSLYLIRMANRAFLPSPGIDKSMESETGLPESLWGIIQFWKPLENETRYMLGEAGIMVYQYLGGTAYTARLAAGCRPDKMLDIIRWTGPLKSEDKLTSQLYREEIEKWAVTKEGRIKLMVSFFEGISADSIMTLLEKYSEKVTPNELDGNWFIEIERDQIRFLSAEKEVKWLEPGPNPQGMLEED